MIMILDKGPSEFLLSINCDNVFDILKHTGLEIQKQRWSVHPESDFLDGVVAHPTCV